MLILKYILCQASYTQSTLLYVLVCSKITVNITIYCVSSKWYKEAHHWKWWSAVQLLLILQYILYQASYTQKHITENFGLQ
jgi:multisubunit Na+/H+ antiporter MnhE subunit